MITEGLFFLYPEYLKPLPKPYESSSHCHCTKRIFCKHRIRREDTERNHTTIRGTYQKSLSVCNNIERSTADESASPKSAIRSSNSEQSDQRRMNLPHRNHHLTSSSSMPPSARNREQSGVSSRPGTGSRRRCRAMPRVGSRAMPRAGSRAA